MNGPKNFRLALLQPCLVAMAAIFMWQQPAAAQPRTYTIDNTRSLVWWQIDPHIGHLWASSCPADPSWQPGEGHSAGYYINYATRPEIRTTHEAEKRIPLFPRRTVRPNCRRAVSGSFQTSATLTTGTGKISVLPDSIETGADARNIFANKYVYGTSNHPTIDFTVDSLTSVVLTGDTVTAIAVGNFHFRGVVKPTRVQLKGVKDASGMRVRGMFAMPASELESRYNVSSTALGMGVGLKLWNTLFMGFDLIFKEGT